MKVIYLHQYFLTPDMAGGTRSYEMARRLVAAGHEVHMITSDQRGFAGPDAWRTTNEHGIHVHWANVAYANHMSMTRRVVAFVEFAARAAVKAIRVDGDVIFATSTPLTIAVPALVASSWTGTPFVFEVRDMWPDVPIAIGVIRHPLLIRAVRWLESTTYRRAAHVVALAPGMREDILAKGVPPNKVTVIPNGCDIDFFAQPPAGPSPRALFSWLGDRKLVLFAGTIGAVNGVDYMVRLASAFKLIDPSVCFVVIGSGKEREAVRGAAAEAGVLDESFFMIDAMPKKELVPWLHAADVHVALFSGPRAVWKDAVQNKFFDALAVGKPIANNFDGWQTRLAMEADVGLALDPKNVSKAAEELARALRDDAWLAGIPDRAKVLASGRFNRDTLAALLERTLASVGSKHRAAAPTARARV